MSDSSLSVSVSTLALVSNGNSAGNISNTKSTNSSNGSTFSIVLQDKTNTDSNANSQSNTVTGANNNLTSTNVQDADVTKSNSDVGYEKDLQEIENKINKMEDGSQKLDDNTTAALLLSLQQILNSILKNSNSPTAQDSKNSSESVSSITISTDIQAKLTELENTLQQIINDLTAANKQATAQVSDNSALDSTLQNENLKQNINDISSLIETTNNNSVDENFNLESKTNDVVDCLNLINKVLSNASSSTNKNINSDLLNKFKTEFSDIIQGLKGNVTSTDGNSSNLLSSNSYAINSLLDSSSNLNSSTSDNSSMNSNSSDKDTEFLNKLIDNSGNDDSNYSKVTNVINQFIRNNDSTSKLTATQLSDPQIRSTNFAQDVINNVKYMENNNIKDMTVTITPKELGQVLINVSSENGVIKASITATNKEAYNLLNSNIGEINKNLNSQDVRISNVDINIYNGDTTFFKGNSNSDKDTNQNGKKQRTSNVAGVGSIADTEAESMTDLYDNNNVNALA
ncbi:flagellar hook-length control protein FliK [Clostridium acidisoli DSM 12555]|uniref:Flagellar hook-length control protein FliK n=1 Tax=Clostridium acidisoli DSM 12555 TaxID=1121291 RepID=A0A1W1X1S1_9CLOT|nr:flagellar hook-length control protein FliK [Clostridium acidisoli]SMC17855.1 flagellar hook-length control protein FliK [Clostridium acidisoli DSM 12555]